jgi:hypothetical protein
VSRASSYSGPIPTLPVAASASRSLMTCAFRSRPTATRPTCASARRRQADGPPGAGGTGPPRAGSRFPLPVFPRTQPGRGPVRAGRSRADCRLASSTRPAAPRTGGRAAACRPGRRRGCSPRRGSRRKRRRSTAETRSGRARRCGPWASCRPRVPRTPPARRYEQLRRRAVEGGGLHAVPGRPDTQPYVGAGRVQLEHSPRTCSPDSTLALDSAGPAGTFVPGLSRSPGRPKAIRRIPS